MKRKSEYLKSTKALIEEYLSDYTGHPSNVKNIHVDAFLPDGNKDAVRFMRDKNGKLCEVAPWLLVDLFYLPTKGKKSN